MTYQPDNHRFSRFVALSLCGWLLIGSTITVLIFKHRFNIGFQTNVMAINSYMTLYWHHKLIASGAFMMSTLFLLIICVRIISFKTFTIVKVILLMFPALFMASLLTLAFNLHQVISILLYRPEPHNIVTLIQFLQNFSLEATFRAIFTLPYQLNSIKYPLYGMIYSYLIMFSLVILFPLGLTNKMYTWWRQLNGIIVLVFIGSFVISAYYLFHYFVLRSPFAIWEQMFSLLPPL